jgi:hypothetical protein
MRLNLASVARLTSIAIVASLFGRARRPRLFPRHCVAYVAVASRSAVLSAVAVSAFWLVVASVASFASQSPVGVPASIMASFASQSPVGVPASIVIRVDRCRVDRRRVDCRLPGGTNGSRPVVRVFPLCYSRSNRRDCARQKIFARLSSIALLIASIGASKSLRWRQAAVFVDVSSRPAVASNIAVCTLLVGCCVNHARCVPINHGRRVDFFIHALRPFLFFLGVEPCSSPSLFASRGSSSVAVVALKI